MQTIVNAFLQSRFFYKHFAPKEETDPIRPLFDDQNLLARPSRAGKKRVSLVFNKPNTIQFINS